MSTQEPGAGPRSQRGPASGLLAVRDWFASLLRRRPLIADALIAVVVLVLSLPPFTSLPSRHQALAALLIVAITGPLTFRRRAPLTVLAVITALCVVQMLAGQQLTDFLAVLIAFYTVAVISRPWHALAAFAALGAGIAVTAAQTQAAGRHALLVWALASGLLAAAGLVGYYVRTTRRARIDSLAERTAQLDRERDTQAELAVSAERSRIAREMHDIVAHNIAVMIALAEGASYTAEGDPGQAAELMGQVSATGRTALTEMRRLLGVLRQPADDGNAPQPTLADLDELMATFRTAGLPAQLAVSGQPGSLPPSAQLAVYRIVTEALTNTLKHAPGASASVRLDYLPGTIGLEITDDGAAGNSAAGRTGAGHGLAGMRERAAVFEATRHIVEASATRVLILTTFDLDEYAYAGLRAGASGFLLKDVPPPDLLAASGRLPAAMPLWRPA